MTISVGLATNYGQGTFFEAARDAHDRALAKTEAGETPDPFEAQMKIQWPEISEGFNPTTYCVDESVFFLTVSALGSLYPELRVIRNQKQRWGSCASDGTLRFNWRIVMAEPTLIDYVVVHEIVHLGIQNPSPKFWREMARVLPNYLVMRQRLKAVGPYFSI